MIDLFAVGVLLAAFVLAVALVLAAVMNGAAWLIEKLFPLGVILLASGLVTAGYADGRAASSARSRDLPTPSARPELLYQVYPELLASHPVAWWQGMGFTGLVVPLTVTAAPLDEGQLRAFLAEIRDLTGLPFYLELPTSIQQVPHARTFWAWRLGGAQWDAYLANVRMVARIGREYGLTGLMWDLEYYAPEVGWSPWQDPRYAWHCTRRSLPFVSVRAAALARAADDAGEGQLTLSLDAIWSLEARRRAFRPFVKAFGAATEHDCFEVFDTWNVRGNQCAWDAKLRGYRMPARLSFYLRPQDSASAYGAILRERMTSGHGVRIFAGPEWLGGAEFYSAHPEREAADRDLYRSLTQ